MILNLQILLLAIGLSKRPISNLPEFKQKYLIDDALTLQEMIKILKEEEVFDTHKQLAFKALSAAHCPAIVSIKDSTLLLLKISDAGFLVQFATDKQPKMLTKAQFAKLYQGDVISLAYYEKNYDAVPPKFDLSAFLPAFFEHRTLVVEIVLASLFIQIFALTAPLFMQVVIDKVMMHQGYDTLDVLAFGLVCVIVFETLLGGLRTYLFSHTSFRIDQDMGNNLFNKLIHLPLDYYRARQTGETAMRIREADNVRAFLTGSTIPTAIDLVFAVVFVIVMYLFSPTLTFIVLASLPFYLLISYISSPLLQKRLSEKSKLASDSQSFLVETVSSIETLKSMGSERNLQRKWEKKLSEFTKAAFEANKLQMISTQGTQLIQRAVMVATLYMGALLVLNTELTVGGMVAFNMLSSRVGTPITNLFKLWQEFQQMRVSMERLRDIMERDEEQQGGQTLDMEFKGNIVIDDVSFHYPNQEGKALDGIALTMKSGTVTGIVGPSGSGKSTLIRLLQLLHIPDNGKIMIDGLDIARLDIETVRRNIGVVLQDNQLFTGSVMDNIRLGNPLAGDEDIINAAKLAGANEFIQSLPQGYDSLIGERGASLSGGQRQKIAIARALVRDPKILVLDEATSALDAESESHLMNHIPALSKDKTVIIIAHRLSTVRDADQIIFLENGKIEEQGAHTQLMRKKGKYWGYYRHQMGNNAK